MVILANLGHHGIGRKNERAQVLRVLTQKPRIFRPGGHTVDLAHQSLVGVGISDHHAHISGVQMVKAKGGYRAGRAQHRQNRRIGHEPALMQNMGLAKAQPVTCRPADKR